MPGNHCTGEPGCKEYQKLKEENARLKDRVKTLEDLNQKFYKDIGEKGRKLARILDKLRGIAVHKRTPVIDEILGG